MRINLNELRRIILEALLNAYDVLGVSRNASEDEIKKAWRTLAIQNHPDRGGAHGKMVDINNAKDRLLDKTALFRYGPTIKGYEDAAKPAAGPAPSATPPPAAAPTMRGCPLCGRTVAVKDGKYVNHYEHVPEAGSPPPGKCPHSGYSATPGSSSGGSRQQPPPADDWWERARRQGQPGGAPGGGYGSSGYNPPPRDSGAAAGSHRYFTFISGTSRKFWEYELVGSTLYIRYGRIGGRGRVTTKTFASSYQASKSVRRMRMNKLSRGYVEGTAPAGQRPSQQAASGSTAGAAPGGAAAGGRAPGAATGRPTKDNYKVYGWKQGRRVVRVGGKLYGTDAGGRLRDGGNTRFNANDRASVTADGSRMKVKNPSSGHTQTWDPIDEIDEVRKVVDNLVMEMIVRIAET